MPQLLFRFDSTIAAPSLVTEAHQVLSQLPHVSVSWAHQQRKWSAKLTKITPSTQDSSQAPEQLRVAKHHRATADDFKLVANTASMLDTALLSGISSTQVTDTRSDGAPLVLDQVSSKIMSLLSPADRKLEHGNMRAGGVEGSSYDRHVTYPLGAPEDWILKPPESRSQETSASLPNATHLTSPDRPEADANRGTTTPLETGSCVTPSTPALELPDRGYSHSPVTPATPNSSLLFEGGGPPDLSTSIFVGGLGAHYAWSETKLQQLFSPYGIILEVVLITQSQSVVPVKSTIVLRLCLDNPMASTFAFVRFADQSQRNAAIDQMVIHWFFRLASCLLLAQHGRQVEGSTLRVQPREPARAWRRMGRGRFTPSHDAQYPVSSNRRGMPTHFYSPSSKVDQMHRKHGNVLGTWGIFKERNEVSSVVAQPDGFYPPLNERILSHKGTELRRNDFETNCIGLPTPGFCGHPVQAGPWVHPYPYFAFGYPNFYGGQVPFPPLPPHPYGSPIQATPGQRAPIQPTGFVHSYRGLTPIYPPEALTGYLSPMVHGGPESIPETTSIHDPALQMLNSRNQISSPYPYYYLTPHFDGRYNFIPSTEQQSGPPPQ
jgi:RNA recognition motif-containing protein